jgi:hypothetical protein
MATKHASDAVGVHRKSNGPRPPTAWRLVNIDGSEEAA